MKNPDYDKVKITCLKFFNLREGKKGMEEETVDSKRCKRLTFFKGRQIKIIESGMHSFFFYKTLKKCKEVIIIESKRTSLVVQWLRLPLLQGAQVQSLAGELRSHMVR